MMSVKLPGQSRWLILSVAVIGLDQLTKWIVSRQLGLYDAVQLLPVFNITLLHNTGAAFSFLAGASGWQRWFFVVLALVISAGIVVWLLRMPVTGRRWVPAALALVVGGALGNVIDRLLNGYVVDFIQVHYRSWYYPAFNVADSAITVGAILLLVDGLLAGRRDPGSAKQE